ncbi:sporulation protein YtfJ [Sporomusaceae bacterium BoRhaA]|uniref:GerW family sporulation protein n=1 Tax=Pelorhabdus rhamnosifermentans TaxID=2772457 RepID=UPI001C061009|nr:GerW family sporulation protein [Pelorhabdus rhamnosifermentans]MBU2701009.1 sporulation protein YtfJ [Pelorhabdus rhamnosifermentans]
MAEHPIQGLMKTAMESIKEMVDVNTIVGDAVETVDGTVIIPISRVTFGFAAGGGDYEPEEKLQSDALHSFGGGSGAGVSVKPVGFLVCSSTSGIRFLQVDGKMLCDRVVDLVPQVLDKIQEMLSHKKPASADSHESIADDSEFESYK